MHQFVAVEGPLKGMHFLLEESTILGRAPNAGIRIDDLTVSRQHCRVSVTDAGCMIEDLGSGNGTFVNGEMIRQPTPLRPGDEIRISTNVFRYNTEAQSASTVFLEERGGAQESPILQTVDVLSQTLAGPVLGAEARTDELLRAHHRLRTVVEVGNAVGGHLETDRLLKEIMDCLVRVFPQVERGFIMLKDAESDTYQMQVAHHRNGRAAESVTVSRKIIDEAISRRVAILSADAMGDQRFAGAMSVIDFQIRSMMCAPLIAANETLGVIHLDTSRQDQRFTAEDLDLFTAVANQTALAVANARMHTRLLKRQRIEQDLALARNVQQSFLPGAPPAVPGLAFSAYYRSALEVGGDFYDFIPLQDGRLAIVVGDVAGKGVPAALMMARMMSDVRFLAITDPDPGQVLARVNESVLNRSVEDAFVTMVFGILEPESRRIHIANAAHCPPVVLRGGNARVIEVQENIGFPIGAMPGAEYGPETLTLEAGDTLILFTDGVTEAMNARREIYGKDRLLSVLGKPTGGLESTMQKVLEDVKLHTGDTPQSDDLTLLGVSAV